MSTFDFDTCPDRTGTASMKWERWAGRDVIPMWVADMDVRAPEVALDVLRRRMEQGILGYGIEPAGLRASCVGWLARRHGWTINPEWLVFLPGVVSGFNVFIRAFGEPAAAHLCPTPAYPPFFPAPGLHGQRFVPVPLQEDASGFRLDAEVLRGAADDTATSILLCQPQNPTGRILDDAELEAVAEISRRHDLWICSDEIWADLILDGRHRPFALAAPDLAARTVTLLAPSKTFNVPGLDCAVAVIPDATARQRFMRAKQGLVTYANPLGMLAAEAVWNGGDAWLEALLIHLRRNRDLVGATMATLPALRWHPPQATYLAWIDARGCGHADPHAHAVAHGLGLSDGRDFGAPGWLRMNFACPLPRLKEGLRRLRAAFG